MIALDLPPEGAGRRDQLRSEEHTSELQSQSNLVCRLLLEKKNKNADYVRFGNMTSSLVLHNTTLTTSPVPSQNIQPLRACMIRTTCCDLSRPSSADYGTFS